MSFGGFAAGPGGMAARLQGRPLLVHEQNRAPGFTNRVLARFARRILTGFPGSFAVREEAVGNPVRAEIAALPLPAQRFSVTARQLKLLVLGGSQGARVLNHALPQALAALPGLQFEVRHQCGEKMRDEALRAYADAGVAASVESFIADMAEAYSWARPGRVPGGASTGRALRSGIGSVCFFPSPPASTTTRQERR